MYTYTLLVNSEYFNHIDFNVNAFHVMYKFIYFVYVKAFYLFGLVVIKDYEF